MENKIDKKLLIFYFSGNATTDQKRQIELWLESNPEGWDFFYQCLEEWERSRQTVDFNSDEDFENLTKRIFSPELNNNSLQKQKDADTGTSVIAFSVGRQAVQEMNAWIKLNITRWQQIAAVVAVVMSLGMLTFIWYHNRFTTYTACGKIRKIMLPDSSIVILNSQAEIRYLTGWNNEAPREVWLEGEAFFSVTHKASQQKFIVHASDEVNIEVLGTEFNVSKHTNRTRVVLNDGKIRLHIDNNSGTSGAKDVIMNPGELIELGTSAGQITKKTVNPAVYSSWKDNRLIFDNSTLTELKMLLEERYKLKVITTDTSLNNIRFNGDFPSGNLPILLNALGATYDLQVTAGSDAVYLKSRSAHNE